MNFKGGKRSFFRGKSCWFILDSNPLVYENESINYPGYNYLTKFQIIL